MSEYLPSQNETEEITDEILDDASRRNFLRNTVVLGFGAVVGVSSPADAEAGVLANAAKIAAARAALKSAEGRLMSEEDKAKLAELERERAEAEKACNSEFNKFMSLNPGKTDKDFLKTQVGIECYTRWGEAIKNLSNFKK